MKKILILICLAFAIIACKETNVPTDPTNGNGNGANENDTTQTELVSTDTIRITWSGTAATVEGSHSDVTINSQNGYVTVNSTVKDITYLLSGNGTGQLTIYGTNRHQLVLNGLTLTCSDGPAINNQCKKSCYVVLNGINSLTDGSTYATSTEDRKAAFFSEGQMIFSGAGSLTVKGNYKHAIASDDYIRFAENTGSLTLSAASDGIHANDGLYFNGGDFTINVAEEGIQCDSSVITFNDGTFRITSTGDKGILAYDTITVNGGTISISSKAKCIKTEGNLVVNDGIITAICTGTSTSSGGGWGGNWGSSSGSTPEGIEAKGTITINGGQVYAQASDDAINAGGDFTINAGCVMAYSTGNDGLDANGNLYIKGGLVYAIGSTSPEMAIDANSEEQKKLYITGGTIIAVGNLESGASISGGTCKSTSSWNPGSWYAVYNGSELVAAFLTPTQTTSSGGGGGRPGGGGGNSSQKLVVYTTSTPALKSGVTASGTAIFNNMAYYPATVSGGSSVTLSNYTSSGGGPGGW